MGRTEQIDAVIDEVGDVFAEMAKAVARGRAGTFGYMGLIPTTIVEHILGGKTCDQAQQAAGYTE